MPEPVKYEPPSEDFENAFRDGIGGCVMDCACGRTLFDTVNSYDWEPGELDELLTKADKDPAHYVALDYAASALTVDGKTFVLGCPCNGSRRYEDWIIRHELKLARYLNKRSIKLAEQARAIRVAGVLNGEDPEKVLEECQARQLTPQPYDREIPRLPRRTAVLRHHRRRAEA